MANQLSGAAGKMCGSAAHSRPARQVLRTGSGFTPGLRGLLNVLAVWDCIQGPAYGYGDEPEPEPELTGESTKPKSVNAPAAPAPAEVASTSDAVNSSRERLSEMLAVLNLMLAQHGNTIWYVFPPGRGHQPRPTARAVTS